MALTMRGAMHTSSRDQISPQTGPQLALRGGLAYRFKLRSLPGFHPAGLLKDRVKIQTKLSTDFAQTLAKEGNETAAAFCLGLDESPS